MTIALRTGLVAVVVSLTLLLQRPVLAGDLPDYRGSLDPGPAVHHYSVGRCYVRADVGHTSATTPDIRWWDFVGGTITSGVISHEEREDTWNSEVGAGCGSGSRGVRGEVVLGLRGAQDIESDAVMPTVAGVDQLRTSVTSTTLMLNLYQDLGYWGRAVPYIGLGIGVALNELDDVAISGTPAVTSSIRGDDEVSFAWALMAGFAYQVTSRAVVDLGYRYIDLGSVHSAHSPTILNRYSVVRLDNLAAHEFKLGVRFYLGSAAPR